MLPVAGDRVIHIYSHHSRPGSSESLVEMSTVSIKILASKSQFSFKRNQSFLEKWLISHLRQGKCESGTSCWDRKQGRA